MFFLKGIKNEEKEGEKEEKKVDGIRKNHGRGSFTKLYKKKLGFYKSLIPPGI